MILFVIKIVSQMNKKLLKINDKGKYKLRGREETEGSLDFPPSILLEGALSHGKAKEPVKQGLVI